MAAQFVLGLGCSVKRSPEVEVLSAQRLHSFACPCMSPVVGCREADDENDPFGFAVAHLIQ